MQNIIQRKFGYLFDAFIIKELIAVATLKTFKKDDIIMDIDQDLKYIPLVLTGSIKVFKGGGDEHELLLYFLEEGDTCAMSLTCALKKTKSKIRAIADKDATILMIPSEKMNQWFENNQSWRNFVLENYQIRFDEMLETIDTLAFLKMDKRLEKYLIDRVKIKGNTILYITHQEIAEDLNTSRVVISRLLKKMENESLIKLYRNKIEVLHF